MVLDYDLRPGQPPFTLYEWMLVKFKEMLPVDLQTGDVPETVAAAGGGGRLLTLIFLKIKAKIKGQGA